MSDPNPTPQWYTPGGATTAQREPAGHPTAPIPVHGSTPPPGPFGPVAQQGPTAPRPGRRRTAEITTVAVLAALLSSGGTVAASRLWADEAQPPAAAASQQAGTDAAPVSQSDPSSPDWSATAAAVSPSVVSITASSGQQGGQGSGVIIDSAGNVLTNNHVVSGAEKLSVTLADGRTYDAEVRGTDPSTDLAVIAISDAPKDLRPIATGDSDALKVGDPVMAVGNPLGLAGTVTTGIVSALNRPVSTQGESSGPSDPFGQGQGQTEPVVTNAIQTSAAINPGNSGGALVNAQGQLVGINSSIASLGSPSGQSGNIGIGFAIPVNEATSVASQLIETGKVTHAFLGVTPQDGSASDGSATRSGAEVESVGEGTPAAEAGLRAGDVVTAVDGERVDSALSLVGQVRERSVGDKVTLTVLRDGGTIEVQVTLAARSTADN
ncbi:MAG: trypsin-like serine protease [Ornithinibacter sp.]|nr:trypsin-like serine protease [Ornithinibacter sp.]